MASQLAFDLAPPYFLEKIRGQASFRNVFELLLVAPEVLQSLLFFQMLITCRDAPVERLQKKKIEKYFLKDAEKFGKA